MVRVAEDRRVGIGLDNFLRLDAADVGDDEVRPVCAVGGNDMMARQDSLELRAEVEIDPDEQDRRHGRDCNTPHERDELGSRAMGELVAVAHVDDVAPGTVITVRAGETEIALARVGDDFYAVQGHCLHLQGPLGEGELEDCVLTCPWHGWQYDVRTGNNEFDLAIQLETYEVQVEDGEVKISV